MASTARMESVWLRSFRFALIGGAGGVAASLGLGGSVFLFAGVFVPAVFIGFPLGGFVSGFLIGLIAREGVGGMVAFMTGGGRGHSRVEYSHAQALVARGSYQPALEVYRLAAEEGGDAVPLIEGARVLRDHLSEPGTAAEWLRRAQRVPGIVPQEEIVVVRELVDLYDGPLESPRMALPELARIAEKYPGTSAGDWAAKRLERLRASVWEDVKGEQTGPPAGG